MNKFQKKYYLISVFLFLIPVFSFLNKINLPQILKEDFYIILFSQISFFLIIFILSFLSHKYFLKNLSFGIFLLINSLFVYLTFFYKNLKGIIYDRQNFIFDDLFILLLYFSLYILTIKYSKKIIEFVVRFLIIFSFLQFSNFLINFYNYKIDYESLSEKKLSNEKNILNPSLIKKSETDETIFFIVLDGMMSLDTAKKLDIIDNIELEKKLLKNNNLNYVENFTTNYDVTYLSLTSLLQGNLPVNEFSKKYNNRNKFFPTFLLNQYKDNNFFKILRSSEKKFFWVGNSWQGCIENIHINCLRSNKSSRYISKMKLFYFDSVLIYFLNLLPGIDESKFAINFLLKNNYQYEKNSIYLIHVLNPHPPFYFSEDCSLDKKISYNEDDYLAEKKYYKFAYNCLLRGIKNWARKIDDNNLIFILGDHGWAFEKDIMKKYNLDPIESRFKIFFSYKAPNRCNDIKTPQSTVNIMRYALNCSGNNKIKYSKDSKYKTFYEDDENYGKVFLKN